jgi:hypothetical protein
MMRRRAQNNVREPALEDYGEAGIMWGGVVGAVSWGLILVLSLA